jgi:putative endonuclease
LKRYASGKDTGRKGEELAVNFLRKAGYRVVERNYRCRFGEIDIVAMEGGTIVFVEVKSRRTERFGDPQLSVGRDKQKKISRIALNYLQEKNIATRNARFDVVAVKMLPEGNTLELIQDAFGLAAGW